MKIKTFRNLLLTILLLIATPVNAITQIEGNQIQDGTIDLTTKVFNILPYTFGGTNKSSQQNLNDILPPVSSYSFGGQNLTNVGSLTAGAISGTTGNFSDDITITAGKLFKSSNSGRNFLDIDNTGNLNLNSVGDSNFLSNGSIVFNIDNDNTDTTRIFSIRSNGLTPSLLKIDELGQITGISGGTTGTSLTINADSLTSGKIANFNSNSADTSTRNLVEINNLNSAAIGTTPFKITQSAITSTHFKKYQSLDSHVIWTSDGTDPNTLLTGTVGDIVLNGNSLGDQYFCVTGTTWTRKLKVYNNTAVKNNPIMWTSQGTTTSGVSTFHPTVDGTTATAALFTTIYSIQATGENNSANLQSIPWASIKLMSADKKTLTINCQVGTQTGVLIGGNVISTALCANGTNTHVTIMGD